MLHHKVKHVVSESDWKIYCDLKTNYNRITQSKKRKYQEKIASEIENLNSNDPQDFRRSWKKHKRNPGNFEGIDLRSFTDYYKTCNQIPQTDLFDYDFMQNIEYLMKTYDEIVPLKLDGILNDILNGPFQLKKRELPSASWNQTRPRALTDYHLNSTSTPVEI